MIFIRTHEVHPNRLILIGTSTLIYRSHNDFDDKIQWIESISTSLELNNILDTSPTDLKMKTHFITKFTSVFSELVSCRNCLISVRTAFSRSDGIQDMRWHMAKKWDG